MDTINKKTTTVGIVTLIVGLALGLGIGAWGIGSTQASGSAIRTQSAAKTERQEPTVARGDEWDPFRQMEQMQEEIDRSIRRTIQQFKIGPGASVFRPEEGYSSSFDLRDRKDHFELRASLPDAEADVDVKFDNDKTLHISVDHRKQDVKKGKGGEAQVTELGHYEQVITLPEAVKSADMKVERKDHEVVITIPKAEKA